MTTLDLQDFCEPADPTALLEAVKKEPTVDLTLDFEGVDFVPTSIVQVLLVAQNAWSKQDANFEVISVSEECQEGFARLGLSADLNPIEVE